jgi:hypothetical protein
LSHLEANALWTATLPLPGCTGVSSVEEVALSPRFPHDLAE